MERQLQILLEEFLAVGDYSSAAIEAYLADCPDQAAELRRYLEVAAHVARTPAESPSPAAVARGRDVLLSQIADTSFKREAAARGLFRNRFARFSASFAAAVLLLLGAGAIAGALGDGPLNDFGFGGSDTALAGIDGEQGWHAEAFAFGPDGDSDGYSDKFEEFAGSGSTSESSTPELRFLKDSCKDGLDNDGDTTVDAGDSGCQGFEFFGSLKEDSDGDGFADKFEGFAGSDPNNENSTPELSFLEDTCSDSADNDADGKIDDADTGCEAISFFEGSKTDTDGDSFADRFEEFAGSDPSNAGSTPELAFVEGNCSDGADNDLDGPVDGDDTGCQGSSFFTGFLTDSDGDGFADKFEQFTGSGPNDASSTPELHSQGDACSDGADNDKDGDIDSADSGCEGFGFGFFFEAFGKDGNFDGVADMFEGFGGLNGLTDFDFGGMFGSGKDFAAFGHSMRGLGPDAGGSDSGDMRHWFDNFGGSGSSGASGSGPY